MISVSTSALVIVRRLLLHYRLSKKFRQAVLPRVFEFFSEKEKFFRKIESPRRGRTSEGKKCPSPQRFGKPQTNGTCAESARAPQQPAFPRGKFLLFLQECAILKTANAAGIAAQAARAYKKTAILHFGRWHGFGNRKIKVRSDQYALFGAVAVRRLLARRLLDG